MKRLQESGKDIEGTEMGEETQKAADLLAEIQTSLELVSVAARTHLLLIR